MPASRTALPRGDRWDRLHASLTLARPLDTHPTIARNSAGARSISWAQPDGSTIEIHDAWWSKNPDVWLGWTVTHIGADSIIIRETFPTKSRVQVTDSVACLLDGTPTPRAASLTGGA